MQKNISSIILVFLITIFTFYPLQGMKKENEKNDCGICLEPYNDIKKPIMRLKCGHILHSECAKTSFIDYRHTQCPLCRDMINGFDYEKNIIFVNEAEHTDIVTPYGIFVWRPGYFKDQDELPKNNVITFSLKYLKSCITILKKPSTWKPLIIPTISLTLPWLINRDTSRSELLIKGCMSAGIFCLLTPYGTSPNFRWFSFERVKRLVGSTLLGAACFYYEDKTSWGDPIIAGSSGVIGMFVESMEIIQDKHYCKNIDIKGICELIEIPLGIAGGWYLCKLTEK